jgi:hypothetical protein
MADQTKGYTITLTKTTPAQTWYEKFDNFQLAPFLGTITSVHIFFPPGCEDLVKVRFGVGDEYLTDWIQSADGKELIIPFNKLVAKDTPTCEVELVEATAQVLGVK